ncbi:MAG: hypothetical protein RLZZ362_263 [Actinomycetota bacterium]
MTATPPAALPAALFEIDGTTVVATELSRGPWDPRHCHGGPVAALQARAVEQVDDAAWQIVRLTIELTRPVPGGAPLTLAVDVERPGRKVSLVAAILSADGAEVARVRALRIRSAPIDLPDDANRGVDTPMPPSAAGRNERPTWGGVEQVAFHADACEHRFVEGSWADPGPVATWIRLLHPVVAGEALTGIQRVAAAADFGNGISGSLPFEDFLYINPDLTVHLLRPPVGEWVGMRTASYYGGAGAGLAESALFDADGRLGRSCQSLFVDRR